MDVAVAIRQALAPKKALVKRRAKGFIKHDYLVPGGPYEEQWDWDGFFIGMALASEIPSEAIYLKNWCLNYLEHVGLDGYTPGLLTPKGVDRRLKHMKPFLAQGCYFASKFLEDFDWARPHWRNLKRVIRYRENTHRDPKTGLVCWYDSMESGADNNPSVLDFPDGSVIAMDLNIFLVREYKAMAEIAKNLGFTNDAKIYKKKYLNLKQAILKYLWDEEDGAFYNIDRRTGEFIKHIGYSNLTALWSGVAPKLNGKKMVKKFFLNPKHLWGKWGLRSLSASDRYYNEKNIIKPHSNWQGPVWPLVNYLGMHALLNYGFKKEARQLAVKTVKLCLNDLNKTGGMHENYNSETGKPLAASNFISWNLFVGNMIQESKTGFNPFAL